MISRRWDWGLRFLVIAGLVVDAIVHVKLEGNRPPSPPGQLSQKVLFGAEALASLVAALLLIIMRSRIPYYLAFLVSASAFGAVVLYRYVDVGSLGPLPDMYEPSWYTSKVITTIAEGVSVLGAAVGCLLRVRPTNLDREVHHVSGVYT